MLTLLPKLALVLCFLIFFLVIVKVFFFTKREEVERMSNLPLEDHSKE
jgi:cbb3-type cytochrome oxidase subunit 3